jgi:hypothetical protein
MNKIGLMESRLGKLERDNRRLKMAFGVMSLLFATVVFISMAMPQQIPDVISAHEFHVIDADGAPRAKMLTDRTSYFDENGTPRTVMDDAGFRYYDERSFISGDCPRSQSCIRALLGNVGLLSKPPVAGTTTYQTQVALYDAEGNVIWEALGGR